MDIASIFAGITSAAGGGLFGLFGTGLKLWMEQKAEETKQAFELKMREMDQAEMQLEHTLKMKEVEAKTSRDIKVAEQARISTEAKAQAEVEMAELNLRQTSYAQDKATYGGGFVDVVRGLMRPILTLYFAVLMSVIAYQLFLINDSMWLDQSGAKPLLKDVINACIFLATTSVTWWFGSRPIKRK